MFCWDTCWLYVLFQDNDSQDAPSAEEEEGSIVLQLLSWLVGLEKSPKILIKQ